MASSLSVSLTLPSRPSTLKTAFFKAADSMLRESRSRSFEDEYEPLSSLGSGGAATVARCVHRASGAVVAAKRIPLASSGSGSSSSSSSSPSSSARQAALVELASLILLQGAPHAIELLDAIEEKGEKGGDRGGAEAGGGGPSCSSRNCVFLVTRLCAGGELFDSIVSKEHYCEREAALVVRSLAAYLAAAHRVGVVHRDLKPENVMLLASSSSKNSSPTKAAAAWPAPPPPTTTTFAAAPVPPAASLQRLPSRLCREASDVAAMLSACPSMRRSSFSGERTAARRRTTGAGTKEAAFFEEEEDVPFAVAVEPEAASSSIEGRRRCSCLEREGIRVIDLGCAALFDPTSCCFSSSSAAAADAFPNSTPTIPSSAAASAASKAPGQSLKKMVGTPYYAAPEVLPNSPFPLRGAASDVWSLGVIAFVLLSGRPPFGGRDDAEVARRVAAGKFSFRGGAWAGVSEAAKSAISSMLEKDPSRRATAAQVLEGEWLLLSSEKTKKEEEEEDEESAAGAAAAAAAAPFSSSSSNAASTRLRARIRAFAAESKLHAIAAVALTRTVSGAEGAAQLREMILLHEGLSESSSEEEEKEEESDDGDDDGKSVAAPRIGGGGAAVVPSSERRDVPPFSHRCSAPGGLEGEQKKNSNNNRSAPGTPRAAAGAGKGGLGGLLRRTLTLGGASANTAAALAAAAAALPPGCTECETCGGIVVVEGEGEEEGERREEQGRGGGGGGAAAGAGAEAFLEGLLLGGRPEPDPAAAPLPPSSSGAAPPPPPPPPPAPLLRTQTTVGPERAAELAFAALDADGDGWLCVEDLLRAAGGAGAEEEEGNGKGGEGDEAERRKKKKRGGASSGGALMTREEALACIAEARKANASHEKEGEAHRRDRMDFDGFKKVLWRQRQAPEASTARN